MCERERYRFFSFSVCVLFGRINIYCSYICFPSLCPARARDVRRLRERERESFPIPIAPETRPSPPSRPSRSATLFSPGSRAWDFNPIAVRSQADAHNIDNAVPRIIDRRIHTYTRPSLPRTLSLSRPVRRRRYSVRRSRLLIAPMRPRGTEIY